MSGHNKWTQIKRQKAVTDAKKSRQYSILARQITLEAKAAGGDRQNPNLRRAIEKAREANLPNDNINRALERATGAGANDLVEVLYEAYGPGGIALIIEGISDNKNRTTQEIKHLLAEHQAALVGQHAALFAFEKTADGWQAINPLEVPESVKTQLSALITNLEEHEDVKRVACNARL